MGDGHFRPPVAPKRLNRFTWNLACVIRSTVRQYTQNMVAAENGGGVGIMGEVRVLFWFFFWFLQCVHSLPWEAWIFSQCIQKRVLVVGVFLLDRFAQGVKSSFLCPQKPFFKGPNKAIILHGSEQETPLMVNDSSVKVAYWIGNTGMGKPNMGLDFTYYLCITWYRECAMQILSINMEILGPPKYLWNSLT